MAKFVLAALGCLLIVLLKAPVGHAHPALADTAQVKRSVHEIRDSYDYVVVGGGTSGLTVANRLSEDPSSEPIDVFTSILV